MKNIKQTLNLTKREAQYIIALCLVISIDVLILHFKSYDIKVDPYLFYAHSRYLDNVLFDFRNMVYFSVSSFILWKYKRVFFPFFILSIFQIIMYFLYYKQQENFIEYPLLLALIIWNQTRAKNKKTTL